MSQNRSSDLVLAFERLSDEVPMDAEEVKEILLYFDIDADSELKRTLIDLEHVSTKQR